MFDKILIANRGEIAVRIARTAAEMGIATVAVYSEPDRDALHVQMADEAFLVGPAAPSQSYLDAHKLIDVARRSGAQAIHPGYGFLAENAGFARQVVAAGLTWIGPHAEAIEAMGDKLRARHAMKLAGVPIVPGGTDPIADVAGARRAAETYGLPLALKAAGGGGGKGLKVARSADEIRLGVRDGPARSGGLLQKRHDLCRTLSRESQARRAADSRRQIRQRPPRGRTRLLAPAPPPKTLGGGAGAAAGRAARRDARGGDSSGRSDRLRLGRHDRMPGQQRRILLSRNEHAHSGRAHGDRDDRRNRLGTRADSGGGRRAAGFRQDATSF